MVNNVIEGSLWCLPMVLPPHKLVQMGRESCPLHTAHVLKSSFCVFPIVFYLVRAGTSDGIHEIVLMNNNEVLVPRNYWNICNIIVATETVAMNYGSRSNVFPMHLSKVSAGTYTQKPLFCCPLNASEHPPLWHQPSSWLPNFRRFPLPDLGLQWYMDFLKASENKRL